MVLVNEPKRLFLMYIDVIFNYSINYVYDSLNWFYFSLLNFGKVLTIILDIYDFSIDALPT